MQIKPGFAMRKIAGSNIVVPVGAASSDFNGMITPVSYTHLTLPTILRV